MDVVILDIESCREGGDTGLFITLVPKFFIITNPYSLAKQLWGLVFNFDRLIHYVECPNISKTNSNVN